MKRQIIGGNEKPDNDKNRLHRHVKALSVYSVKCLFEDAKGHGKQ